MNWIIRNRVRSLRWWKFSVAVAGVAEALLVNAPAFEQQPAIGIAFEERGAAITFSGILLAADTLDGPWRVIADAESPYVVADLADAQKFYRAGPVGTNSIFSSRSLVALGLSGPFQAHFDLAFAGTPDGIIPPVREKPYFDGTLVLPGLTLPVNLRVRGNSSLQECPFPKLKFKVSPTHRPGTPFVDAREIKIGTHCAEGGHGHIGRLRDQTAAFREVSAYEVLALLDFLAPRARRARLEYHDTTPPTNANATVGWRLTREALILEDIEVMAERLGGRVLTETETSALELAAFDPQFAADLQCFHALLGNWDYSLGWDGRGVWNTDVLELTVGTKPRLVPVAGDFDLASWVTGLARRSAPRDYHPELGDIERETRYALEQARQRVAPANFLAARQRFADKRALLESHLASARIDEEGRANALRHVAAFYDALEAVRVTWK